MKRASSILVRRASPALWAAFSALAVLGFELTAHAEEPAAGGTSAPSADPFSNFFTRETLTGDWGGTRKQLADKGVTLDLSLTQVYQGVLEGGLNRSWQYGGRTSLTLSLDSQKMGLWPGGFLTIRGEGKFGEFDNSQTGALLPADVNALFPEATDNNFSLPTFQFMQFLSPNVGVILGKIDTSVGDDNAFAHGRGNDKFLNINFSFNAITAITVPYSTLGAGLIFLPTGDPREFIISAMMLDTEGRADTSGVDTVFKGGTTFTAEGRYTTHFFHLTGHHTLGGVYSDRLYLNLDQQLSNVIIPGLPIEQSSGSWAAYYNFDQYLYQPDEKSDQGFGIFGRIGTSDGQANPMHWTFSGGIGGKGVIPGRKDDRFGLGYYYIVASDAHIPERLNFGDGQGFEAFYEIAITPAIHLTPDIQVISPGQQTVDTAIVLGVRLEIKF